MKQSLKQLEKQLESLEKKLEKKIEQKRVCVNDQFKLEDNDQSHTRKYERLIEKDFELADDIQELERLIRNKKAQIRRKERG